MTGLPVRQLAYKVNALEAAAEAHHRRFGSGPFFVARNVALSGSRHRGVERPFDHSSAYGQWGSVMVELVVQHNAEDSALHEMYPYGSGREGLHHAALFVDDLDAAIARFAAEGAPLAQLSVTAGGTAFAFVDTRASLGHMLELYEPTPLLTGFYDFVAAAVKGWDGKDLIRELGLPIPVRAELVEAPSFLVSVLPARKKVRPFDKLRANGCKDQTPASPGRSTI